jgi:hypothetical protein
MHWEARNTYGRPNHRWEGHIKMDLGGIGSGGLDCINLAQDRNQWRALVNTKMKHRVPQNVGEFLSS